MNGLTIVGNWKMHGRAEDVRAFARGLALAQTTHAAVTAIWCPPACYLAMAHSLLDDAGCALGGQDCAAAEDGAHTGALSAGMVADVGARWTLVGHSETRVERKLDDAQVARKASAALRAGLTPIMCVGESARESDATAVVRRQVEALHAAIADAEPPFVAYEPVWAIGAGETPTPDAIAEMHAAIRDAAARPDLRVLYGGSVTPHNAAAILAVDGVDGLLVGSASRDVDAFSTIVHLAAARLAETAH